MIDGSFDALLERRIVAELDSIADRKAKPGADLVEFVEASDIRQTSDFMRCTQIDLNPFFGFRFGGELTVVSIFGAQFRGSGLPSSGQRLIERDELCSAPFLHFVVKLL